MRDDESELIKRLKDGEEAAQSEFWHRYKRDLYRFLVGITRGGRAIATDGHSSHEDHADAEDVLAVTFIEFFRDVTHFNARSSLKTYLFKIAINNARDHYRRDGKAHPKARMDAAGSRTVFSDDNSESVLAEDFPGSNDVDMPELVVDGQNELGQSESRQNTLSAWAGAIAIHWGVGSNDELRRELADQISRLPENYRMVISLRICMGFSVDETARLMRHTAGAVKMAQMRALRSLRERVNANITTRKG